MLIIRLPWDLAAIRVTIACDGYVLSNAIGVTGPRKINLLIAAWICKLRTVTVNADVLMGKSSCITIGKAFITIGKAFQSLLLMRDERNQPISSICYEAGLSQ